MNNLKRILSLALASVMLIGMMVVGASATDYVDDADIENKTAVETMAALGIMNGDERGFRPQDGLTRAEAAKMLAKLHHKGVDIPNGYATKDVPTFKDIKGHWAEDNIEYAAAFGIANGKGNGIFDPQGSLTVVELVRMCLNMMGYTEGQTGADWALQTTVLADNVGLFKGLEDYVPSAKVTRDQAALITSNAIFAPMADAEEVTTYVYKLTKKSDNSDMGTFDSAAEASGFAQGNGLTVGQYTIERVANTTTESLGSKYLSLKTDNTVVVSGVAYDATKKVYSFSGYTTSIDMTPYMGLKVQVLYKGNNKANVYGVVPTGKVLYTGAVGDIVKTDVANKITIGATTFNCVNANKVLTTWNTATTAAINTANAWNELTVIDNDGDGKIDLMLSKPVTVARVSSVSKTGIMAGTSYLFKNNDIEDGLKQNDWVTITGSLEAGNKIVKLPVVENVTATEVDQYYNYTIGGEIYCTSGQEATGKALSDVVLGKTYDLVALNGYVFNVELHKDADAAATVQDVVLVTDAATSVKGSDGTTVGGTTSYHEVIIMGADGKSQTVKVSKVDTKTAGTLADVASDNKVAKDTLYICKAAANGYYELTTLVKTGKWEGYDVRNLNAATIKGGKTSTGIRFNDNALVYVVAPKIDSDPVTAGEQTTYRMVNGAEINKWDVTGGTLLAQSYAYTTNAADGFPYADLAILVLDNTVTAWPGTTESSIQYGYLTADAIAVYDADAKATVARLTIWNGAETVTRTATLGAGKVVTALANFPAGKLVSYIETADGKLTDLKDLTEATLGGWEAKKANAGFVVAYNGGNAIQITDSLTFHGDYVISHDTKEFDLAKDDPTIIYIDQTTGKGTEGAINLAQPDDDGDYVNNVYAVYDTVSGSEKLLALFVEVNNEIDDQMATKKVTTKITPATKPANAGTYKVTVSKSAAKNKDVVTVTVERTAAPASGTDTITLTGAAFAGTTTGSISGSTVTLDSTTNKAVFTFIMGTADVELTLNVANS